MSSVESPVNPCYSAYSEVIQSLLVKVMMKFYHLCYLEWY